MLRRSLDALRRHLGCSDDGVISFSLATIAASFALMFWNLDAQPFWVDEAIAALPAVSILREGVPRNPMDLDFMAPQLQDDLWDPSAPLYRYSLAAVAALLGFSETTTRGFWPRRRSDGAGSGSWTRCLSTTTATRPGREPVNVDCRLKYCRFYEACTPSSPTFESTCARLKF